MCIAVQEAPDAKEIDEDIKARMKDIFVNELLRRYAITSTLEMAQGTVVPLVKYPADDIVVEFYKKERDTELAGEDWDAEADCEYLREAMRGPGMCHIVATILIWTSLSFTHLQKRKFK